MKRFVIPLWIFAASLIGTPLAMAGEVPSFEVGYSSYSAGGFRCSTGTVSAQMNATRPTGWIARVAGYRIVNQDSADAIWVGGASVSTATANGDSLTNLGVQIAAGGSAAFSLGKDYARATQPNIPLYCMAANAAGAAGAVISLEWFGY